MVTVLGGSAFTETITPSLRKQNIVVVGCISGMRFQLQLCYPFRMQTCPNDCKV